MPDLNFPPNSGRAGAPRGSPTRVCPWGSPWGMLLAGSGLQHGRAGCFSSVTQAVCAADSLRPRSRGCRLERAHGAAVPGAAAWVGLTAKGHTLLRAGATEGLQQDLLPGSSNHRAFVLEEGRTRVFLL